MMQYGVSLSSLLLTQELSYIHFYLVLILIIITGSLSCNKFVHSLNLLHHRLLPQSTRWLVKSLISVSWSRLRKWWNYLVNTLYISAWKHAYRHANCVANYTLYWKCILRETWLWLLELRINSCLPTLYPLSLLR